MDVVADTKHYDCYMQSVLWSAACYKERQKLPACKAVRAAALEQLMDNQTAKGLRS